MRRWILCAAMAALLMATTGCGGGGSKTPTIEQEAIPSTIQARLGIAAQQQLRTVFHDRKVEVTDITCERQYTGVSACRLKVVDGHGRRGTVQLGVRVNARTRAVTIGFAGASNRAWLRMLMGRRGSARGSGGAKTTPRRARQ